MADDEETPYQRAFRASQRLDKALKDAGITGDPLMLEGTRYTFFWEGGSHFEIQRGIVGSPQLSDAGELIIEVSARRFRNRTIVGLIFREGGWSMLVDRAELYPGDLLIH